MDVEDNSQMLKLFSEENTEHSINFDLFSKFSLFIKDNIIEQNTNEALTCALNGSQIEQILQFVKEREHDYIYKPIPKPIPSGNISLYLQEKDYNFLTSIKSEAELYVLLKSAQYFRIEIITEMIYAYIAAQFIDKTSGEMREKYGIQEQLTEQAEKNLRETYAEFLAGTPFDE